MILQEKGCNMEEAQQPKAVDRKKRVQRLKKIILLGLTIGIVVPWVLCIILFGLVLRMNDAQKNMSSQLLQLEELIKEQQTSHRQEYESLRDKLLSEETELEELANRVTDEIGRVEAAALVEAEPSVQKPESSHKVYLTFDDGPSVHTNEILDILKNYHVKATFFVLGKEDEDSKQALQRIVEEGHSLGMHSYNHQYSDIYSSREAFAADFEKIQDYLFQVTGVTSKLYRFPGGSSNTVTDVDIHVFIDYLKEQNTAYFDWNISSGDAAKISLSAETIVANATRGIESRPVSVILFHDAAGRESTVQALPEIIERIQAMEGTEILPITEETEPVQHVKGDE